MWIEVNDSISCRAWNKPLFLYEISTPAMTVSLKKRKISVEDYHKMIAAGILTEQDRVELINGEMIEMSPIGSKHSGTVNRLCTFFVKTLGDQAIVSGQNPVVLSDLSEPEPDIAILHPRDDFYSRSHPQAEDVYLIIEVADSSIDYDREIKIRYYAEAGIPEYWIVDLEQRHIEAYRFPEKDYYKIREIAALQDKVVFHAFEMSIAAHELIGH